MQWILIILGIVLAVVALFALQNPDTVTVRFLNFEADASVLVVILISFAAGVLSGILALLPSSVRKSGRLRKARSDLRQLEKALPREKGADAVGRAAAAPSGPDARRWREAEAEAARTAEREQAPPAVPPAPGSAPGARPGTSDDGPAREARPPAEGPPRGPETPAAATEPPARGGLGRFFR